MYIYHGGFKLHSTHNLLNYVHTVSFHLNSISFMKFLNDNGDDDGDDDDDLTYSNCHFSFDIRRNK